MRKGTSINLHNRRNIRRKQYRHKTYDFTRIKMVLREEWKMLTLVSLFLSGMIIGAISVKHTDNILNARLVIMFSDYTMLRTTQSFFQTFINSFTVCLIFLIIVFIAGLCAVGAPIIAAVPLFRGIGLGVISGYLYTNYSLSGAGFCMTVIFPSAIISTATLLFGCNESFIMSYEIYNIISGKIPNKHGNLFKKYSLRFSILLIIMFISAIIDTITTIVFASKFSF